MGLSKLSARCVLKALHPDQRVHFSDLSLAILNKIEADEEHFLARIISGDAIWIHLHDPESKQESNHWLPRESYEPINSKHQKSTQNLKASIFWGFEGKIDHLTGQRNITGDYYTNFIRKV